MAKALVEAFECRRRHRFRTIERKAPTRQIDAVELTVANTIEAQRVGEVRSSAHAGAVVRDRLKPTRRTGDEKLRRHQRQRSRTDERGEKRADETHVVIERQPRDPTVLEPIAFGVRGEKRAEDRVHVGKNLRVRQRNCLGSIGRARRELNEPQSVR